MQIIEPTEKAFVLSEQEKETIKAAANILEELGDNINDNNPIVLRSSEYANRTYSRSEVIDLADYIYDFTLAETITERS